MKAVFDGLELPTFAPAAALAPLIVALEGPNGAGKSTLCRRLGRQFGASTCLGTPPAWCSKAFKTRMIRNADWVASALFFLSGCLEQMRVVASRPDRLVIMDRSLWSTLAVHAAQGPERLVVLLDVLKPVARVVRVPDLTLVLEASAETCWSRISRKDEVARALDQLTANRRFHAQEQQFYRWLGRQTANVRFLDIDHANAREAAQKAAKVIEAWIKARQEQNHEKGETHKSRQGREPAARSLATGRNARLRLPILRRV